MPKNILLKNIGINGTKRILAGLVLAVTVMFLHYDVVASQGETSVPQIVAQNCNSGNVTQPLTLTDSTNKNIVVSSGGLQFPGNLAKIAAVSLDSNIVGLATLQDTTRPTVIATDPANGDVGVALNKNIAITFSEQMNPSTINTTSLTLTDGQSLIAGTVTYGGVIATFIPSSNLAPLTKFTATINTSAKDLAGNKLARIFTWSFTTGSTTVSQAPVVLNSASTFAVLAGSTVTNTGPTMVNGALGVSAGTAVVGFPPGIVNGMIFTGVGSAAGQAQLDLTTAYNDAAGRTLNPVSISGNLGGLTLPPGLYKSTSSLEISAGDLTLDAQGDVNAVFIFQMASTLTTTVGRQVILSGGAKAANIFWQVGSSATLGTNSAFKGTIMANQAISLLTGASLDGRALARIAAVTLDTNIVGFGSSADTTPPTVISTDPKNREDGVLTTKSITATFSEEMNPLTINTTTMTVTQGGRTIPGKVTYAGVTATFTPFRDLLPLTKYTVTITTGAQDLTGNNLAISYVWKFTTRGIRGQAQPTVNATNPVNDGDVVVAPDKDRSPKIGGSR